MDSNLTWIEVTPTPKSKQMLKDSLAPANRFRIVMDYIDTPNLGG
jgi:hypothetical protein